MTVVILVNMILTFQSNVIRYFSVQQFKFSSLIQYGLVFFVALSILIWFNIVLYKGEYRIPIQSV